MLAHLSTSGTPFLMSIEQLIVLALVQGITEFLPVSSSGHLNLIGELTSWSDQGILIDIAVHMGTLIAVIAYFRREVWQMIVGFFLLLRGRVTPDGRLALFLIIATLPAVIAGFFVLRSGMVSALRGAEIVAWANLFFALVLYATDKIGMTVKRLEHMETGGALAIGIAQVFSLIPGASRAGVTMSMARFLGYERKDAARFSMLLSIPTIIGAAAASIYEVVALGDVALGYDMALAAGLAAIAAFATIAAFMRLLEHMTLTPFVIYRLLLGAVLLGWIYY
jgi:undecaprenyl-diphosphatase